MKQINAPVLLIAFNRPDTTQKVFDAIKIAKPNKLYFSVDAPRAGNVEDEKNVAKVKEIINKIDWDCQVHKKFAEINLGCGPGPASAISWVFENEDRAIILEDDCVPAQSFFPYCDELLERYKDDKRVWTISGNNFYEEIEIPYSYIFSKYGHSWGWATWQRCWEHFDIEMKELQEFLNMGGFDNILLTTKEAKYFNKFYQKYLFDKSYIYHIWDVQANFAVKKNNGLSIIPSKNLVKNIGLIGTHSNDLGKYHNRAVDENYSIKIHPAFVFPLKNIENGYFAKHWQLSIIRRLKNKFMIILKKL